MAINAAEYTVTRADQVTDGIRSSPGFRAFERSATVLALGGTIWFGFFMYDLFSNTIRSLEQNVSELTESPFMEVEAVVNPAVITEEGISQALRNFRPGGGFRSKAGYEAALRSVAKTVDAQGVGTLTNAQIALVKDAEGKLIKGGMLTKSMVTPVHPVDKAANFVTRNKNYWALILGLSVLPIVPVIGSISREALKSGN